MYVDHTAAVLSDIIIGEEKLDLLVKDIVKIWNNGDASLVAGKEGILRKVEVFDMMEQPNIKPWLREHFDFDNYWICDTK